MKILRKIIEIDEDLCNGCGNCVISCAEGSLAVIDGKARIISDKYCDGLGACIGECPTGALTIVERQAEEFDAEAVEEHLADTQQPVNIGECVPSNWPIQIRLIPSNAPFLKGADLLVAADCVPAAFPGFHGDLIAGKVVMMGCPKFDDAQGYIDKFKEIFEKSGIKSITVATMEVPCCSGLPMILKQAMEASVKKIPLERIVISTKGKVLHRSPELS